MSACGGAGGPVVSAPVNAIIKHGPTFALLEANLEPGETLVAEAGAMVARSSAVSMEVKFSAGGAGFGAFIKGLFTALIRKVIGGETFFVNHFTAPERGKVWLAPKLAGHIVRRTLKGDGLILSRGAYLASSGTIEVKPKFGGLRGFLSKEGLFFLHVSGTGEVWFTSYGGVHEEQVEGTLLVDNGHIVGFEESLGFEIRNAGGGLFGFLASGEGLACEFRGQGKVYLQSRNLPGLSRWVTPFLP